MLRRCPAFFALIGLLACNGTPRPDASAASQTVPGIDARIADLRALEYRASPTDRGLQAPNRAQGLRTFFEPRGAHVEDRVGGERELRIGIALDSIGRAGMTTAIPAGEVSASGARVEIRRDGLLEWFVNSPAGLEHGFTVAARPAGEGELVFALALEGARARRRGADLELATDSGRRLRYGQLHVTDADGRVLLSRFELADAGGARIVVADTGARYPVTVDPILTNVIDVVLDPQPTSPQFAGGTGTSVAFAGDVDGDGFADVAVGTPFFDQGQLDEGVIAIFYGAPTGFRTVFTLLQSDQPNALLGTSVAGAGDVNGDGFADVIAGAGRYNAGQDTEGAAFVFLGSANRIAGTVLDGFNREVGSVAQASARLESNQIGARLGDTPRSVAGIGDVNGDGYGDVAVGAPYWESTSPTETDEGAAWVFLGSSTGIANGNPATASATLQSNVQFGNMGYSVAGAGDLDADGYGDLVVGAPEVVGSSGSVCLQYGGPSGIASATLATCTARLNGQFAFSRFGSDVAGAGDTNGDGYADLAIGARTYTSFSSAEGAVFIWRGGATRIASGTISTATDSVTGLQSGGGIGESVSSLGDMNGDGYADLAIGASTYDGVGAAFVFLGGPFGIGIQNENGAFARLDPVIEVGGFDQAAFGASVSGGGDANGDGYGDLVVGAPNQDHGFPMPAGDRGRALVFFGGGAGIQTVRLPFTTIDFPQNPVLAHSAERFGFDVAPAGDVNGDGRADLVVSAFGFDGGQAGEGAAIVYMGGTTATTVFQTDQNGAQVNSARSAGDVNGDGYGDLIVGSASYNAGQNNEGAAFILLGSATGITSTNPTNANAQLESNQIDAGFGNDVASAGDVNGDGFADVIVAADLYDAGEADEGAAFIFHGSAAGIASQGVATANARFETNQAFAGAASVAGGGDVNRDGFSDVIVGSPRYQDVEATQSDEGSAFVLLGSAAGIATGGPSGAHARLESDQPNANLGTSVAFAGDVNGDSFDDVITGAPFFDVNGGVRGAALVFHGSAAGVVGRNPAAAARVLAPALTDGSFGASLGAAGDVNGDGFADVVVGAPNYEVNALPGAGSAFVYSGSAAGIVGDELGNGGTPLFRGFNTFELFGTSVDGIGDYNGDGFSDVAAGAPDVDATSPSFFAAVGEVWLYHGSQVGSASPARAVRAHQLQTSLDRTVQPLGSLAGATSFRVRASNVDPGGRGRIKLEVEACPLTLPFGSVGCLSVRSASWTDVGASATPLTLTETVSGLTPGTAYRWRARTLRAPFRVTQAGISAPAKPAHGPWRRLHGTSRSWDLRSGPSAPDGDLDGVPDATDNCPVTANADQADGDSDAVGNVCDSCTAAANPRVAAGFLTTNPWATLTGGQRDDDHDGFGNKCDAKFPGVAGTLVGSGDLTQFRTANGKNRTGDTCGTTGTRPCAIFDLDESSLLIGTPDLSQFRLLNGKAPGPKCATCPLTCTAGVSGTCGAIP